MIKGISPGKPNVVGFSGELIEGGRFLVSLEISPTGSDCQLMSKSDSSQEVATAVTNVIVDLISIK